MVKLVELGHEAVEYIRSELLSGNDLAQFLLELPFETGNVISYVPAELNEQDIPAFGLSIFLTRNIEISRHILQTKTEDFISSYLQSSTERYAIFETYWEVGDAWLEREKPIYFSYDSKLYLFLRYTDTDNEKVKSAMGAAGTYPFIAVLTHFNFEISNHEVLSEEKLETLAKSADHIIIGAFDDESYLIWSKPA